MIWRRKRRWHDNLLSDIIEGKMLGKTTRGRKRVELLHDVMEGRDYGQLKDLIADISIWRQDSN